MPKSTISTFQLFERFPDKESARVYLAVEAYRDWVASYPLDLAQLRGKDLACFCPLDQPCHADILLELAND